MTTFTHKEGHGSLFQNEKKMTDAYPDYTGDAMYNGEIIRIALWKKQSKTGKIFLSLKLSPPREKRQEEPRALEEAPRAKPSLNDEIPF